MTATSVSTPDGRDLEVLADGPEAAQALVYHHGTPGGAVFPPGLVEAAGSHGLRTVVVSRPGYGESSPRPGRTVADVAADTAAVLDALGVDRFVTLGWSGGGPHALACAALLDDRCEAAGMMAGAAPYDLFGPGWLDGMGEDNVEEFSAASQGKAGVAAHLEGFERESLTREAVLADIGTLFSPVDVAAFEGPVADYVVATMAHGVLRGTDGWEDDDVAFMKPWGFAAGDVTVPVAMWQGREDRMVPYAHGEWLAAHVPGIRPTFSDADGHLTWLTDLRPVVDALVSLRG